MAVKVREDIGEICEPNKHRQEEQAIRSQPKAVRSGWMNQSRLHAVGGDCATLSNPIACCVTVIDTWYILLPQFYPTVFPWLMIDDTFWMFQQSFTSTGLHMHMESVALEQPTFSMQEFYFHMQNWRVYYAMKFLFHSFPREKNINNKRNKRELKSKITKKGKWENEIEEGAIFAFSGI